MKTGNTDHRTRMTRMLIRKAFLGLLIQKPIQSISIKELCEHAGINRGTFYMHYADIFDLRKQIEDELFTGLVNALDSMMDRDPKVSPVRVTTELFQLIKDNSDLCAVTLGDHGDKEFLLKIIGAARAKSVENYAKYFQGVASEKIEYYYAFISSGCMGILQKWLASGMRESPDSIATTTENLILRGIGFLREESQKGSQP